MDQPPQPSIFTRDIPDELLLIIGAHLSGPDLYHLILANRRFSLFLPQLRELSLRPEHAKAALCWAVLSRDRGLAKHVLEKGEDVTIARGGGGPGVCCLRSDTHYKRTVHRSPDECKEETLNWLMRAGIGFWLQIGRWQDVYVDPIGWAIKTGHHALLRLSLSVNALDMGSCSRVILEAAVNGNETAIDILLDWARSALGEKQYTKVLHSAFFMVVDAGLGDAVRFFLRRGLDANVRDSNGRPVLVGAVIHAGPAVVKVLLEEGADVNVKDSKGELWVDSIMKLLYELKAVRELVEKFRGRQLQG